MKATVIIPGFGDPHWDHKIHILRNNMKTIESHAWDVSWIICHYSIDKPIPTDITGKHNVRVISERGILAQNLYRHGNPKSLNDPDIVILLLDDVELVHPFPWEQALQIKQEMNIHVVSPCLTEKRMSVWNFMIHQQNPKLMLKIMTRCELFCYIMDFESYKKYYEYVDEKNPWMWGMDFILTSHMQLRTAILNQAKMIHHHWRSSDTHDPNHDPRKDSDKYLAKYGTEWAQLYTLPSDLQHVFSA